MLSSILLLPLALSATASPLLRTRQSNSGNTQPRVIDANWDSQCFYPEADDDFELEDYLGRWYQIAGTPAPYTSGCSCIYAEYSLNSNGTVNVANGCQVGSQTITIEGTATVSDERYGDEGVFQVQFPGESAPACPGPNYIVQEYDDDFAIVQASNFSTLFILSRQQVVSDSVIDRWIERAGRLGSNLDDVVKVNQTGCVSTTSN